MIKAGITTERVARTKKDHPMLGGLSPEYSKLTITDGLSDHRLVTAF